MENTISQNPKIALITGATSGIGKALSEKLANEKFNLIITGRREHLLEHLKSYLEKTFPIEVLSLCFDVRNREEIFQLFEALPENWKMVDVLINNAGLALGVNTIDNGSFEDWDTMIDTNVKGILNVSKPVIEWMKKRQQGQIINLSSIAGKEVYLNGNVYCASKYAVEAISKSMRIDLLPYNIKVTNIAPGMVETEFSEVRFYGDKSKAKSVYNGLQPLIAEDVADVILFAINRPAHVNINDLVIMPTAQASTSHLLRKS